MINLNELEKVITAGKVVTLVIMVDGKELAAVSFTVDTVAFKEILEAVVKKPVTIAEKPVEKPVEKKTEPIKKDIKKEPVDKNDKTKRHPEFNPIPATAEVVEEDDDDDEEPDQWTDEGDDNDSDIDKSTGEVKEFTSVGQPINTTKKSDPVVKKPIEPVSAATLENDDIIPEQIIVTDKKETVKQDVKNEKVQAPIQNASPEISFSDEKW